MARTGSEYLYSIIISILLSLASLNVFGQGNVPDNQLDYHFSWDGTSTVLQVDLYYQSSGRDSTVFIYGNPTPGGLTTIFDIIGRIKTDPESPLAIDPSSRKITVWHKTSGIQKLHYEIDGKLAVDTKRARPNEAFRPTIAPGFFYSLGYNLYLDVVRKSYTQISVVWDHWPKQMGYFISTNPEATPSDRQVVPFDQRNSLLIQMNENLERGKYMVNGVPSYLITSKSDTINHMQEQMKPFMSVLIPHMRNFWKDDDFNFYFVSLIPLRNNVPSTMTGIGLINGFGTRYSGPLDKDKIAIIAHEVSHTWIGVRLQFESVGMENEWFDEGFNDYVAIYNLVQAGMFDQKDFLHYTNTEVLKPYYTNPQNTLPGDSIAAGFWKSKNVEKIPYHRGFIYAFYLDNQIRLASKGQYTLHDFLLKLYQQSRKNKKETITQNDFTEAVSTFLPQAQVSAEIKTYMLNGRLIDFRNVHLIDAFRITYQQEVPTLFMPDNIDIGKVFY